jgi:hypothetical protein
VQTLLHFPFGQAGLEEIVGDRKRSQNRRLVALDELP